MKQGKQQSLLMYAIVAALTAQCGSALADHGSMGFGLGTASPIITDTAITLPQGKTAAGVRTQYIAFKQFSNAKLLDLGERFGAHDDHGDDHEGGEGGGREIHSVSELITPSFVAAYGVTDNLTVGLRFPYVIRKNIRDVASRTHVEEHEGESHEHEELFVKNNEDVSGIGDTTFWGQYRFFNTPDNLTNVAVLFAVKTPTGRTNRVGGADEHGERELLDVHLQPGSGSWDGSLGLAFTQAFGAFSFDSSVLYTWVTKGTRDLDMGDIFAYNFALSWSPGSAQAAGLQASSNINPWTFIVELNGEWRDKENTRGVNNTDSGGHILYVSPGVRYAGGENWNIGLSVGAPIVSHLDGFQVEPDYRIINRINVTF